MNDDRVTYTPYVRDDLIARVGFEAALLACKLPTFADKKGTIIVSFSYLAEIWSIDKRRLIKAAEVLDELQIWHYKKHQGRGCATEWKKGTNFAPFVTLKKVQILQKKGTNFAPNNKDNNKDRLTSARACATNQPIFMEDFEQFWQAFFFGSYKKHEKEQAAYKERAHAVWVLLPAAKRERLLRETRAHKRYDKSHFVLWYIQNYNPAPPVWYDGDTSLSLEDSYKMTRIKINGKFAYCWPKDQNEWVRRGAQIC